MSFPEPSPVPSSPPSYSTPSRSDLAAVVVTVSLVGILIALLFTWLAFRLRRASHAQTQSILISPRPPSTSSYVFRPSFAPSDTSSKFGFTRKPLRLSHRHEDGGWDFADPDPFSHPKEIPFESAVSPRHRPAPLASIPAYTPRACRTSTYKDEHGPRTPTTPSSFDFIEPPPPAYCPGSFP